MGDCDPIFTFVPGAPIQVGYAVEILGSEDETFDNSCINQKGVVQCLEYDCGCGQTFPDDPMIGVLLEDGHEEEFWIEELRILAFT